MPSCTKCGSSGPLYRNNAKGQPAVWRCIACVDVLPPASAVDLVEIIHSGGVNRARD